MNNIDVYILCGGIGKRLKSVSGEKPKSMLEVGNRPFLDIIIDYMAGLGFRRFILGIGYKAEVFKRYYSDFRKKDLDIILCEEKAALGTGGAVKKAKSRIKSNLFLVLNGDSFCEFDPLELIRFHNRKKAIASVLLRKVKSASDYGRVKIDKDSHIIDFNEKNIHAKNCFINAGVYVFGKKIFGLMPRAKVFSLEYDFFPRLASKICFGYTKSGFFIDIGTPERYLKANEYFLKMGH